MLIINVLGKNPRQHYILLVPGCKTGVSCRGAKLGCKIRVQGVQIGFGILSLAGCKGGGIYIYIDIYPLCTPPKIAGCS